MFKRATYIKHSLSAACLHAAALCVAGMIGASSAHANMGVFNQIGSSEEPFQYYNFSDESTDPSEGCASLLQFEGGYEALLIKYSTTSNSFHVAVRGGSFSKAAQDTARGVLTLRPPSRGPAIPLLKNASSKSHITFETDAAIEKEDLSGPSSIFISSAEGSLKLLISDIDRPLSILDRCVSKIEFDNASAKPSNTPAEVAQTPVIDPNPPLGDAASGPVINPMPLGEMQDVPEDIQAQAAREKSLLESIAAEEKERAQEKDLAELLKDDQEKPAGFETVTLDGEDKELIESLMTKIQLLEREKQALRETLSNQKYEIDLYGEDGLTLKEEKENAVEAEEKTYEDYSEDYAIVPLPAKARAQTELLKKTYND